MYNIWAVQSYVNAIQYDIMLNILSVLKSWQTEELKINPDCDILK